VTLLIAFVGMTLGMVAGMPTMVRSRFSTPTIGRDWMIGELGSARTDIDPDGVITLRDAPWRARTNRATPIRKDEAARVVAIEGLVLEVEPEEGGARDYRERTPSGE
jgi:membrane-bound serine protease (ClpP class)